MLTKIGDVASLFGMCLLVIALMVIPTIMAGPEQLSVIITPTIAR
jgi:hypothetical protein